MNFLRTVATTTAATIITAASAFTYDARATPRDQTSSIRADKEPAELERKEALFILQGRHLKRSIILVKDRLYRVIALGGDITIRDELNSSRNILPIEEERVVKTILSGAIYPPNMRHQLVEWRKQKTHQRVMTIEKEFGVKIYFDERHPELKKRDSIDLLSPEEVENALPSLRTALLKYPKHMFQKPNGSPQDIYLVKRDFLPSGKTRAGTIDWNSASIIMVIYNRLDLAMMGIYDHTGETFDHEFFHAKNRLDSGPHEDASWTALHQRKNVYVYRDGAEAINHGMDHIPWSHDEGFLSVYGKAGGPDEDQAVYAQKLLEPEEMQKIAELSKIHEIIRRKVEMQTGAHFRVRDGHFDRTMTEDEYRQKFGTSGYEYFARWSRDKDGKIWMDYRYWNRLIDGNPMTF